MPVPPDAARRVWRNKPRLVALSLVAAVAVAASTLQSTATIVLQQTLDENWRGAYDILVTKRGSDPTSGAFLRSEALVEAATGGLSMADLALIRALPGVEVAAPIAQVSFSASSLFPDPQVWLPVPVRPTSGYDDPQAFRITVASRTAEGDGPRELSTQQLLAFSYSPRAGDLVVDTNGVVLRDADGHPIYAGADIAGRPRLLTADSRIAFEAGDYDPATGTVPVGLVIQPRPAGTMTLIDPVAERALLGEAGRFLDPLVDFDRLVASGDGPETSSGLDAVPIITRDHAPASLEISVAVEEFDGVTAVTDLTDIPDGLKRFGFVQYGQLAPLVPEEESTTSIATYDADIAASVTPFTAQTTTLGGLSQSSVDAYLGEYFDLSGPGPRSILQPRYVVPEVPTPSSPIELVPRAYISSNEFVEAPTSRGAPTGALTEYSKVLSALTRGLSERSLSLRDRFTVVGSYSDVDIAAATAGAAAVPLGGYDRESPSIVATPDGTGIPSVAVPTSLTGFGVPGTNDMAIGSIRVLSEWGVAKPITSIRLRISGLDTYGEAARDRLLDAVVGLSRLGFTATVVAGSSPQELDVLVRGFALAELDDTGLQQIGDLGYIRQSWSRFGAVIEAEAGVTATSAALLALATASVGAIVAAVQLGSIPARRDAASVLRMLGWRRRRIVAWFAAEEAIAIGLLVVVGAGAITLAAAPMIALASIATAIGLVVVTSAVAVIAGARGAVPASRLRPGRRPGALGVTRRVAGIGRFGARQARANLAATLTIGVALLLLCAIVAVAVTIFVEGRRVAGPSELGALATLRALVPQGALVAIGLVATGALAFTARRMRRARRREQSASLRAMGWTTRERSLAALAETSTALGPALLIGVLGAAAVTAAQSPEAAPVAVMATTVVGLAAIAVVFLADRRLD